jgi:hypothetical protein
MGLELIPAELRERPQWVIWRRIERGGKATKVPYQATCPERKAATDDPTSWSTYQRALTAFEQGGCDGIGFVFTAADQFVGCDLDHCRDPETGELVPAAEGIASAFATYQEVSQSGTGVHIIMVGRKPKDAGCKKRLEGIEVELYEAGRYFCMTGDKIGEVTEVRDCRGQLDDLCGLVWPPSPEAELPPASRDCAAFDDRELIEKMFAAKTATKSRRSTGETRRHTATTTPAPTRHCWPTSPGGPTTMPFRWSASSAHLGSTARSGRGRTTAT